MVEYNARIHLKNVKIAKRNFSGRVTEYNERGDRTFLVIIGPEQAHDLGYSSLDEMYDDMKSMEWKISKFRPREDDEEEPKLFMPVKIVYYERRESKVFMKTGHNSVLLTEDTVGTLDRVDIESIDIIINKHYYNSHNRTGYNNEVKSMEVLVLEDEIESRNARRFEEDEEEVHFQ